MLFYVGAKAMLTFCDDIVTQLFFRSGTEPITYLVLVLLVVGRFSKKPKALSFQIGSG